MGKLQVKDSNDRNHCTFTLRCINKGILPVSVRLKTKVNQKKPRKLLERQKGIFYRLGLNPSIVS